jgi:hypothetical protein
VLVQLRFHSGHTSDDYVTAKGWLDASLIACPIHPKGGCGFARHGTYPRKSPAGTLIARWYCPLGHCTFSLLPDHLAARFPGTLSEIEEVVAAVESASSIEAAADVLRTDDVTLTTAVRWIRRRLRLVRINLTAVVSLLPDLCLGIAPTIHGFGRLFCAGSVLVGLRDATALHLAGLSRPLGFRPPAGQRGGRKNPGQQCMGPDPPTKKK